MLRTLQREAFPFRQFKFRTDFNVKFVSQVTFFRDVDLLEIQIRLADRRELFALADLSQAVHQDGALHLIAQLFSKFLFNQLTRRPSSSETGNFSVRNQVVELLSEISLDIFTRDCHGDVTLARTFFFDVNR